MLQLCKPGNARSPSCSSDDPRLSPALRTARRRGLASYMRSALLRHASARRLLGGGARHSAPTAVPCPRQLAPLALQSRPLALRCNSMTSPMGGNTPAAAASPAGATADAPPLLAYIAQYAKSGRAACQGCKLKIDKGALRVGTRSTRGDHGTLRSPFR